MKNVQISVRMDTGLKEDLAIEASNRGQDIAALIRTFIRDGLARHNAANAHIEHSLELADIRLRRLETMVGSIVHLLVESQVLVLQKEKDETHEAYVARLKGIYADKVRIASDKGITLKSAVRVAPQ